MIVYYQNVLPALRMQCDDVKAKLEKEIAECRELQLNIDSMNIVVREPPPIGNSKVVCGHCHHKGHRNQSTNPCNLTKCTDYTYCGVKDKHHEYFQMENFKTKCEYHFVRNISPCLFAIDILYKTNKAKLMRNIKLLRTALDGCIPEVTANDAEQLQILIKKCKTDMKSEVDTHFSSDNNMSPDSSEDDDNQAKKGPVQHIRRREKLWNKRLKNKKNRKRQRNIYSETITRPATLKPANPYSNDMNETEGQILKFPGNKDQYLFNTSLEDYLEATTRTLQCGDMDGALAQIETTQALLKQRQKKVKLADKARPVRWL